MLFRSALVATTSGETVSLEGGIQAGRTAAETRRILLQDVASVTVGISPQAYDREKTVLEFSVVARDPFDGYLLVHETAKAVINVKVKK